jgi:cation transport regulator ChaC
VNLFAYGTLMTADGFVTVLGERARGFRYRVATLPGWRRIWNAYREEWQGGVLNAERSPSEVRTSGVRTSGVRTSGVIVGVLVQGLTPEDLSQLDSQEDTHLPRQTVTVELENGESVSAQIYVCPQCNYQGPPSPRYLAAVLERAAQAGPAVLESVRIGTVDANGRPLHLG